MELEAVELLKKILEKLGEMQQTLESIDEAQWEYEEDDADEGEEAAE